MESLAWDAVYDRYGESKRHEEGHSTLLLFKTRNRGGGICGDPISIRERTMS